MRLITELEEKILRCLAHYKYMTAGQLVRLSIGSKSYVSIRLKKLREEGYIGVSQYGGVYKSGGAGRAENINYLLPKGARLLAENSGDMSMESIHYPKDIGGMFRNDYMHRISTVNTQISFELWVRQLGYEVMFFQTYFHKIGSAKTAKQDNPLRSLTRITFEDDSFIEPDAIFAAQREAGKQFFACLEVHNGVDVSRIVEQLKRLSQAIGKGLITNRYKAQYALVKSPRVLVTLETENMLRLVKKRMVEDSFFQPDWMKQAFLFQVAENVWTDFDNGWQNMEGTPFQLAML